MTKSLSSAGLLYLYMSGSVEDDMVCLQQVDSYRYVDKRLYREIMENAMLADHDENTVHIFAIVGAKEKATTAFSIIENEMKQNFQRILSHKKIRKNTQKLDDIGNSFCRCVQEFYCDLPDHFPKRMHHDCDDIVLAGICCNHESNNQGDSIAHAMVSLWLKRERPMLCGQQVMTRSFFMRDFAGRKVISSLPDAETGYWRLIFEGGHQLLLSDDAPYSKETLHPKDIGVFTMSNLQTILLNPIYAYGKWFQPNDICEEWHKVFLYLCAISETEWTSDTILEVYEKFLAFLEENICEIMDAPPIISKEKYAAILLIHIADFRNFLKGEDEPVNSKDLHQTLNSRYVYLPYLWQLVNPTFPQKPFSSDKFQELIDCASEETDTYTKGVLWEDVAAYVLGNVAGWKITGRRIKAGAQEIDLSTANASLDNDLWQLGAYVLVECKNWNTRVDIHQIRNIAHISSMKGNKTAILFAANGITADAQEEIYRLVNNDISVVCITADQLKTICSAEDCRSLILNQWNTLQEKIDTIL